VFETAVDAAAFVGGPMVQDFERDFARFCESRFCVGVANGTDALRLALIAAGIRPGDTVVTVPFTFIATAEAISQVSARPDFVDIDEHTYTMAPEKLRAYLENDCTWDVHAHRVMSRRTGRPVTAVIPVHLYGQMADMDPILDLPSLCGADPGPGAPSGRSGRCRHRNGHSLPSSASPSEGLRGSRVSPGPLSSRRADSRTGAVAPDVPWALG
jgi:hypothetical protein